MSTIRFISLIAIVTICQFQYQSNAFQRIHDRTLLMTNAAFMRQTAMTEKSTNLGGAIATLSTSKILSIRAGAMESDEEEESDEDENESESESESEDDESSEDEIDESETNEEDEEEDEEEEEEDSRPTLSTPVKITFSTSLYKPNPLIDQTVEITASPSRTVSSLKQSISKQLKSKPPVDCIVLRLDGVVLDDGDVIVSELVDEHDDEEDEEEDDDDDMPKLKIQVDIIPPVDPKFGTEFRQRLDDMTNEQVLDAYVANMAAMHQNSMDLMKMMATANENNKDNMDEDEDEVEPTISTTNQASSLDVQQNALVLKEQIMASLSEKEMELLRKSDTPSSPSTNDDTFSDGDILLKESLKRKRKRRGGATMNVRRTLQKNLNINWADTIRNFLLFLFFGYFGGRNATSRTIMLLGAPACFVSQARPVKIAMKQLFYAIGKPPGLFLSLLPAPQQTIMSCDYNKSLKGLYGDDVGFHNELIMGGETDVSDDQASDVDEEDYSNVEDYDVDEYDEYDEE